MDCKKFSKISLRDESKHIKYWNEILTYQNTECSVIKEFIKKQSLFPSLMKSLIEKLESYYFTKTIEKANDDPFNIMNIAIITMNMYKNFKNSSLSADINTPRILQITNYSINKNNELKAQILEKLSKLILQADSLKTTHKLKLEKHEKQKALLDALYLEKKKLDSEVTSAYNVSLQNKNNDKILEEYKELQTIEKEIIEIQKEFDLNKENTKQEFEELVDKIISLTFENNIVNSKLMLMASTLIKNIFKEMKGIIGQTIKSFEVNTIIMDDFVENKRNSMNKSQEISNNSIKDKSPISNKNEFTEKSDNKSNNTFDKTDKKAPSQTLDGLVNDIECLFSTDDQLLILNYIKSDSNNLEINGNAVFIINSNNKTFKNCFPDLNLVYDKLTLQLLFSKARDVEQYCNNFLEVITHRKHSVKFLTQFFETITTGCIQMRVGFVEMCLELHNSIHTLDPNPSNKIWYICNENNKYLQKRVNETLNEFKKEFMPKLQQCLTDYRKLKLDFIVVKNKRLKEISAIRSKLEKHHKKDIDYNNKKTLMELSQLHVNLIKHCSLLKEEIYLVKNQEQKILDRMSVTILNHFKQFYEHIKISHAQEENLIQVIQNNDIVVDFFSYNPIFGYYIQEMNVNPDFIQESLINSINSSYRDIMTRRLFNLDSIQIETADTKSDHFYYANNKSSFILSPEEYESNEEKELEEEEINETNIHNKYFDEKGDDINNININENNELNTLEDKNKEKSKNKSNILITEGIEESDNEENSENMKTNGYKSSTDNVITVKLDSNKNQVNLRHDSEIFGSSNKSKSSETNENEVKFKNMHIESKYKEKPSPITRDLNSASSFNITPNIKRTSDNLNNIFDFRNTITDNKSNNSNFSIRKSKNNVHKSTNDIRALTSNTVEKYINSNYKSSTSLKKPKNLRLSINLANSKNPRASNNLAKNFNPFQSASKISFNKSELASRRKETNENRSSINNSTSEDEDDNNNSYLLPMSGNETLTKRERNARFSLRSKTVLSNNFNLDKTFDPKKSKFVNITDKEAKNLSEAVNNASEVDYRRTLTPNSKKEDIELDKDEKLIKHFNCAYVESILLQGFIYITTKKVVFRSWFNSKTLFGSTILKIPYTELESISKSYYLKIFDNSIKLLTKKGELLFTSFVNRDKCYDLLVANYNEFRDNNKELFGDKEDLDSCPLQTSTSTTNKKSSISILKSVSSLFINKLNFISKLEHITKKRLEHYESMKIKLIDYNTVDCKPVLFDYCGQPKSFFKGIVIDKEYVGDIPTSYLFSLMFNEDLKIDSLNQEANFWDSLMLKRKCKNIVRKSHYQAIKDNKENNGTSDIRSKEDIEIKNISLPEFLKEQKLDLFNMNLEEFFKIFLINKQNIKLKDNIDIDQGKDITTSHHYSNLFDSVEKWTTRPYVINVNYVMPMKKRMFVPDESRFNCTYYINFISPTMIIIDEYTVAVDLAYADTFYTHNHYRIESKIMFEDGIFKFKTYFSDYITLTFTKSCFIQGIVLSEGLKEGPESIKFVTLPSVKTMCEEYSHSFTDQLSFLQKDAYKKIVSSYSKLLQEKSKQSEEDENKRELMNIQEDIRVIKEEENENTDSSNLKTNISTNTINNREALSIKEKIKSSIKNIFNTNDKKNLSINICMILILIVLFISIFNVVIGKKEFKFDEVLIYTICFGLITHRLLSSQNN